MKVCAWLFYSLFIATSRGSAPSQAGCAPRQGAPYTLHPTPYCKPQTLNTGTESPTNVY